MINELLIIMAVGLCGFFAGLGAYFTRSEKKLIEKWVYFFYLIFLILMIVIPSSIFLGNSFLIVLFIGGALLSHFLNYKKVLINFIATGIVMATTLKLNFGFGALFAIIVLIHNSLYQTLHTLTNLNRKTNFLLLNLIEAGAFIAGGVVAYLLLIFASDVVALGMMYLSAGWLGGIFSRSALNFKKR